MTAKYDTLEDAYQVVLDDLLKALPYVKVQDTKQAISLIREASSKGLRLVNQFASETDTKANMIIKKVALHYGFHPEELQQKNRKFAISNARHIACYLIRTQTELSYAQIGMIFGQDHSTVVHNVKAVTDRMTVDKVYRKEVMDIEASL